MALTKRRKVLVLKIAAGFVVLAVLTTGGVFWYADRRAASLSLVEPGRGKATRIYGAPLMILDQSPLPILRVLDQLNRLGYRAVSGDPAVPGEYRRGDFILEIYLRGFSLPHLQQPSLNVAVEQTDSVTWRIRDVSGAPVSSILLEPPITAELTGPQKIRRDPVSWPEIPDLLKESVMAAEDKRFFEHGGIDYRAIIRAAIKNVTHPGTLQGGSTITQQLAKNFFLSPRRTIGRKLIEAALALRLERRFSKEEIFTLYLNNIYLGQDGPVSVVGVKSAAWFYFGKPLADLTLPECATIAGMIRFPRDNPGRDAEAARRRRDVVLHRMARERMITPEQLTQSLAEPVQPVTPRGLHGQWNEYAYFVSEVIRDLADRYSDDLIRRDGLQIHTTMDVDLQSAAQKAVRAARRQAALVSMDPQTGQILALVGGKDFRQSQFNRATQSNRQPGSAFKPFVFGAALEKGFTPATILDDRRRTYRSGNPRKPFWRPENFGDTYHGRTTLREALAQSMNLATLDLAERIGPERIIEFAWRAGIQTQLEPSLALALGSSEVSLLELCGAYAPFANGGFRVAPYTVTAVLDAEGNELNVFGPRRRHVIDPELSSLMTSLMTSVVTDGTAKSLARLGWTRPSAGKTGTTNEGKDAWFIGYTPELLTGVWTGDDQNQGANSTGGRDAVPVWAAFMSSALTDLPPTKFTVDAGLVNVEIDRRTGMLAHSGCPEKQNELFLAKNQPTKLCDIHNRGVGGWLEKLFGGN